MATGGPSPPQAPQPPGKVYSFDFTQPCRFKRSLLAALRRSHEALAQNAARRLSKLLATNVKVQLVGMEQMKWEARILTLLEP